MANVIQLRRDTAANWTAVNPILHDGEIGLEKDTNRSKLGDGITAWNDLAYGGVSSSGTAFTNDGFNFENGSMEYGIDDWITYKDTAQDFPEDGKDGEALYTEVSIETDAPLIGDKSLLITKSAGNAQGEGVAYGDGTDIFSLDEAVRGQVLQFSLNVKTLDSYESGDYGVYLLGLDTGTLHKLGDIQDTNGRATPFSQAFIPSLDDRYYRMILQCQTANVLAYKLVVDNFQIGYQNRSIGDVGRWEPAWEGAAAGVTSAMIKEYSHHSVDNEDKFKITVRYNSAGDSTFSGDLVIPDITQTHYNNLYSADTTYFNVLWNSGGYFGADQAGYPTYAIIKIEKWIEQKNITLISGTTEYYANNGGSIDTSYDKATTVKGMEGAPLLANTDYTFKDVEIPNLQPNETVVCEIRSKIDGSWVEIPYAGVESYGIPYLLDTFPYGSDGGNVYHRGIALTRASQNVYRVRFSRIVLGTSNWNYAGPSDISWAQIIGASDGYDNWRLRKKSGSNPGELSRIVRAVCAGPTSTVVFPNPYNYSDIKVDTHGAITTGAEWRFTSPIAQYYLVEGTILQNVDNRTLFLYKNDVVEDYLLDSTVNSGRYYNYKTSVWLDKDDYIYITAGGGIPSTTSPIKIKITGIGR